MIKDQAPVSAVSVSKQFNSANGLEKQGPRKRLAPLSVRLSEIERSELERLADGQSLNSYVKACVFNSKSNLQGGVRRTRVPDRIALSQALGLLGAMDLANCLRTLSDAAKDGTLPVSPELEEELVRCCAAIVAIKSELMKALGYSDKEEP